MTRELAGTAELVWRQMGQVVVLLPDARGCDDEAIEMCVYEAVRALGGPLETQGRWRRMLS